MTWLFFCSAKRCCEFSMRRKLFLSREKNFSRLRKELYRKKTFTESRSASWGSFFLFCLLFFFFFVWLFRKTKLFFTTMAAIMHHIDQLDKYLGEIGLFFLFFFFLVLLLLWFFVCFFFLIFFSSSRESQPSGEIPFGETPSLEEIVHCPWTYCSSFHFGSPWSWS